jgi:hypothetical protein
MYLDQDGQVDEGLWEHIYILGLGIAVGRGWCGLLDSRLQEALVRRVGV